MKSLFFLVFSLNITSLSNHKKINNTHSIHSIQSTSDLIINEEHAVDLLKVCFSSAFDCRILERKTDSKLDNILLIGERSDLSLEAANVGHDLLRHYDCIGKKPSQAFKGFFSSRVVSPSTEMASNILYKILRLKDRNKYSLTQFDSDNHGTIINLGYIADAKFSEKILNEIIMLAVDWTYSFFCSRLGISEEVQEALQTLKVSIKIHGHQYVDQPVRKFNSLGRRENRNQDDIIATNILHGLVSCTDSYGTILMAAVIGSEHLFGVRNKLVKKDFHDRTAELVTILEYYRDHDVSLLPNINRNRDVGNPVDSNSFAATLTWFTSYPIDFIRSWIDFHCKKMISENPFNDLAPETIWMDCYAPG